MLWVGAYYCPLAFFTNANFYGPQLSHFRPVARLSWLFHPDFLSNFTARTDDPRFLPVRLFLPPERGLHLFAAMPYSLDGTLDGVFASSSFLGHVTDFPILSASYELAVLIATTLRFLRHFCLTFYCPNPLPLPASPLARLGSPDDGRVR